MVARLDLTTRQLSDCGENLRLYQRDERTDTRACLLDL
jgi:hypothetical protein